MKLDARRAGEALSNAAPDLVRVWRSGRAAARPNAFPGLLDGVVESFLARAGEALAEGRDPALVWPAVEGVVRVDARDARRTREELEAEWDLLEEVLQAACRALDAWDAVREWLARAVVMARSGARELAAGGGPPGVLSVKVYSDPAATRRGRAPAPR
ncbi:MAG TPA: hypothetical protein VF912_21155 [Anaeromyxobacter sp.]